MNAIDRLAALRPTDAELDRLWDPADRAAVLERVLDSAPAAGGTAATSSASVLRSVRGSQGSTPGFLGRSVPAAGPVTGVPGARRSRRRPLTLGLAAAAVAAVAVAVPLALPAGAPGGASPAAAAELDRLAAIAAAAPFDTAGPDELLHMVVVETQRGGGTTEAATWERTLESWTAADGTVWRKDAAAGVVDYYRFAAGSDYTADPSPAYLASLPTDTDALLDYLRHHVSGSGSTDAAVFTAVGDMLRGGFAPPALRTAAIGVLKKTAHVELGDATTDELGRPVVELDFVDQRNAPGWVDALYFATDTAEIVQESTRGPGQDYRSVVRTSEVVDAVPDEVLQRAVVPVSDGVSS